MRSFLPILPAARSAGREGEVKVKIEIGAPSGAWLFLANAT
jgi:hypothetical protein